MTTARITSLSPQVYQATLHAAKQVVAQERAAHAPAGQTPNDAAASRSFKAAGIGDIVDVVA